MFNFLFAELETTILRFAIYADQKAISEQECISYREQYGYLPNTSFQVLLPQGSFFSFMMI